MQWTGRRSRDGGTALAGRRKGELKDDAPSVKGQGFEDLSFAKGCWEFSLKW